MKKFIYICIGILATSSLFAGIVNYGGSGSDGTVVSSNIVGNLQVTNFNNGTGASSSTFWRGDLTWASIPASSGYFDFIVATNVNVTATNSIGASISLIPYILSEGGGRVYFQTTNGASAYIELRNTGVPQWQFVGGTGESMTFSQGTTAFVNNNGNGGWQATANGQIMLDGRGGANILMLPVTSGYAQILGSTHLDGSTTAAGMTITNGLNMGGTDATNFGKIFLGGPVVPHLIQVTPSLTNVIDKALGNDFHINLLPTNSYVMFTNSNFATVQSWPRDRITLSMRQPTTTNISVTFLGNVSTNFLNYTANTRSNTLDYLEFLYNGATFSNNLISVRQELVTGTATGVPTAKLTCMMGESTPQILSGSNVDNKKTWGVELWNQGGFITTNNQIRVPSAGRYRVTPMVTFDQGQIGATAHLWMDCWTNNALCRGMFFGGQTVVNDYMSCQGSIVINVPANTDISLNIRYGGVGNATTIAGFGTGVYTFITVESE
jgi:hypothetical protein